MSRRSPARTLEAREQELTSKAYDLAERQIDEGSASSQVITHFLKMGSTRELVEQEKIRGEIELQKVKAEQLEGQKRIEAMYGDALAAMRSYSGQGPQPETDMIE
jgi:hypothetical protein